MKIYHLSTNVQTMKSWVKKNMSGEFEIIDEKTPTSSKTIDHFEKTTESLKE